MRLMGIALAILMAVGCSSADEKVNKTENSANSTNSINSTNNTNNTNSANSTNSNPNNCLNNVQYPQCPLYHAEVRECPEGATCVSVESCGITAICERTVTPLSWRAWCADFGECGELESGCSVDEDCALVPAGDPCGCTDCLDDAIESANATAYQANFDAARAECDDLAPCPDIACVETLPHCNLQNFQCEARQAKYITTNGLPDTCDVASDCVAVFAGEVCDPCQCPNEAIPASEEATYRSAFDVDCESGVACDCAPYEVDCVENRCELVTPN